jgi:hypothetical protein
MKTKITLTIILLFTIQLGFSQGFVNLNFENATFVSDPSSGFYPSAVYASNAIPGWTAYVGGSPTSEIFSNNLSLSGGAVSIIGTNWTYPPIEGKYFMLLMGFNFPGFLNTAGIGQTGQIPADALTLTFWGFLAGGEVTFNSQILSINQIGSTANYNVYATDISAFAGQTGQLLFTSALGRSTFVDNIQFSDTAVPEPSALGLSALSGLLFAWRRWKK